MLRIATDYRDARAPRPGGWGRYARELVTALRAEPGLEVAALAGGWPGPEAVWEQVGLPLAAAARRADVVHAPNCFLPLVRRCAGVVTVHDLAFEALPEDFSARTGAKYRWVTPRAVRSAERVIVDSAFTRDDLCARYGVDAAKVRVVPLAPALPVTGFVEGSDPFMKGSDPYILGVGDLRAKKNWLRLAQAWRALGLEHRLVIAGADRGEGPALREAGVTLTGYLPDAQLDALIRGADALIHPPRYEGFGLVVLEAQARGVPVAVARGTALPEAGGRAAVTFDPLDPEAIAAGIEEALSRSAELRVAGPLHAAGFTWARTARATAEVYAEAAGCR